MTIREDVEVPLLDLGPGEAGTIDYISLPPADEHFLMRIGLVPGAQVKFCRRAPLGDPSVYSVDGTEIALRAETAGRIMVQRDLIQQDNVERDLIPQAKVPRDTVLPVAPAPSGDLS